MSSNRVVGLGGAYIAVAEGADGHLANPASFTTRYPYTRHDDFDWDFAFSWLNVGGADQDIDQSGQSGFDRATLLDAGLHLAFNRHGYGLHLRVHNYFLSTFDEQAQTTRPAKFSQVFGSFGYAYSALDGELTLGGALTVVTSEVGPETVDPDVPEDDQVYKVQGGGLLLGLLFAPHDTPYRMGATLRTEIIGSDVTGRSAVPGVPTPARIIAPMQLGLGFAWMLGPRPFNPKPDFGDWVEFGYAKPDPTLPRRYVLLAADAVFTGPADDDTVGTQSLLAGRPRAAGQAGTWSLRAGAESELWVDVLRLRAGTYFEPDRHAGGGRWHGTGGLDLHLGELIYDWKLSSAVDGTVGYFNWGLGLGFWH
ncbi:MAG: hypothetical protein KC613_14465 [Myxococcales bacterium]|nr:hypothetical protein [Myxococcales bacterium]MCB9525914.1 hypothetical protein [Myxococcales bacterium]